MSDSTAVGGSFQLVSIGLCLADLLLTGQYVSGVMLESVPLCVIMGQEPEGKQQGGEQL